MQDNIHIKASAISAFTEVLTTHPIDYAKTIVQNNHKKMSGEEWKNALKTPYKGVASRLIGIVPILTGALGWCPLYIPFGISTMKNQ